MGMLISRFRSKKSTVEVLEHIEQEIDKLEGSRKKNQERQRRLIATLILYSILTYIGGALVFYFYFFPEKWKERFLYSLPLLVFPLVIWAVKRILHWYFVKRIAGNDTALQDLRGKKKKILEEVMEKETYKKAKEILEKYDPARFKEIETPKLKSPVKSQPGTELRQRTVQQISPPSSQIRPGMTPRLPVSGQPPGTVRPGITPYGPRAGAQGMQPRTLMVTPQVNGYGAVRKVIEAVRSSRATCRKEDPRKKFDSFDESVIKRTVHRLHKEKKFVSLTTLSTELRRIGLPSSLTTLRKYLSKLGFKHKKKNGRRFAKETMDIVSARHDYLRQVDKHRREGLDVVYIDETWVNKNHACQGGWSHNGEGPTGVIIPDCEECGRHIPSGKGDRLIVLDAGSMECGFIEDVELIFPSKTKSVDYHDEMNGRHFLEWFEETLCPALDRPSVIVMDNAPYHNIKADRSWYPRGSCNKTEIVNWLANRGIQTNDALTKKEQLDIVCANKPAQIYQTDNIAMANGHCVLRLPVRHCELNPIEIIQGTPQGPPLPRPILPRERGVMDRLLEYLVGDGPQNRYALICKNCFSHNGMALKEEFEYVDFRCCYCFAVNPSKKKRPYAPSIAPQRQLILPQPSGESHDENEADEEDNDDEEENSNNSNEDEAGQEIPESKNRLEAKNRIEESMETMDTEDGGYDMKLDNESRGVTSVKDQNREIANES